jgi:hypothetical protein
VGAAEGAGKSVVCAAGATGAARGARWATALPALNKIASAAINAAAVRRRLIHNLSGDLDALKRQSRGIGPLANPLFPKAISTWPNLGGNG